MLSQCANAQCSKPFLQLREGKLFQVETESLKKTGASFPATSSRVRQRQRHVERYWLCSDCAAQWTLTYDRERGIMLVLLRRPVARVSAIAGGVQNGAA
jgi:hypothetical protein